MGSLPEKPGINQDLQFVYGRLTVSAFRMGLFFLSGDRDPHPLFFTLDVNKSPALYILIRALDDPYREFRGFSSLNITLFKFRSDEKAEMA